jgi:hypothetical protein
LKASNTCKTLLLLLSLFFLKISFGQGRVVINEYMPWTLNGCGSTSEFVELLNFGPGPVNIACYTLTDGDYAVTIPANTILQPGAFYVIAGQDLIAQPCANIDSTIHADLNWNNCGCTSGPIPTIGDGFFTDGGNANEQVVLLDPNLNIVDAVVRDFPAEPSSLITTAAAGCASQSFDLDLMNINYETLGMSTGRGNSFARKLDGDCGWVKDPQQSGNATNNTSGDVSAVNYSLTVVKSMDCDSTHGSIDIFVNTGSYSGPLFPMSYTIALDINNDGVFDFSDSYSYGVDSTATSIAITGLPLGRYKITVASVNGCFLKTFDISILECVPLLPVQLAYFKYVRKQANTQSFEWQLVQMELIRSVHLEKSMDGRSFTTAATLDSLHFSGARTFEQTIPASADTYYRLRLTDVNGRISYSPIINTGQNSFTEEKLWPNPAKEDVTVQFYAPEQGKAHYELCNMAGSILKNGFISTRPGQNLSSISLQDVPAGIYQLSIRLGNSTPLSLRFVKQ